MNIIIKETGKGKSLSIYHRGIDWFADFGEVSNQGWDMDDNTGMYIIPQEDYDWWQNAIEVREAVNDIDNDTLREELLSILASDGTSYESYTADKIRKMEQKYEQ